MKYLKWLLCTFQLVLKFPCCIVNHSTWWMVKIFTCYSFISHLFTSEAFFSTIPGTLRKVLILVLRVKRKKSLMTNTHFLIYDERYIGKYSVCSRNTDVVVWWATLSIFSVVTAVQEGHLWCHLCLFMPLNCQIETIWLSDKGIFLPIWCPYSYIMQWHLSTTSFIMGPAWSDFKANYDRACLRRSIRHTVGRL